MNKEEIENKKRMLRDFSEEGQGQRVFFEEDLKLIGDMLKELEQKEFILDKVTDKLKEDIEDSNNAIDIEEQYYLGKRNEAQEILNIIEGDEE